MTTYTIGQTITGTFSKLPFTGTVIGSEAECIRIQVNEPVRSLPVCNGVLTIHPAASNVTLEAAEKSPAPYRKEIIPAYEQRGKRQRLTGFIGELYDGELLIHAQEYSTNSQAEVALDALAFELLTDLAERGLIDELPAFDPTTCVYCHKPHNPQSCPEKNALLFAPVICSLPDNMCDVHKPCAAHAADAARYLASEDMQPARCATCGGEGYCPDCGTLFMSAPLALDFAPIGPEV